MKLFVDRKNNVVIASGSIRGRKITAVAVCMPEDSFDEEKGKEIATLKYKIKAEKIKKSIHESNVRGLKNHILWAEKVLKNEKEIVDNLDKKIDNIKKNLESKINNK